MASKRVSKASQDVAPVNEGLRPTVGASALNAPAPDLNDPQARYVEFGATGLRQFAGYVKEEWLKSLQGWQGVRVLREMRDNDPVIGAFFFAIEMLLRGVTFACEGASAAPADQQAADFVNSCMADLEQSWSDLLAEILTFLPFGWSMFEIVYKVRGGESQDPRVNSKYDDGMVGWRKFAGRAQETLLHWEFNESGDAIAMIQLLPTGGPLLRVPLEKALHFRTTPQKNNPEGRPIIRNAYRPWFFKKRIEEIEAVGLERDLTGLPIFWVPARITMSDASAADKSLYESIKNVVRNTARNEQEGFVLPQAWDDKGNAQFKLELLTTGGRRQFDTTAIIQQKSAEIAATVLADFITLGNQGRGSYAMSRNKTDMFSVAVIAFLDIVTSEFNRKAIPDLLEINGIEGQVKLAHGDIARRDLTELAQYVNQLTTVGAMSPDSVLEEHLREEAGLPPGDQTSTRSLDEGDHGENDPDLEAEGEPGSDATANDVTATPIPRQNKKPPKPNGKLGQGAGAGESAGARFSGIPVR